MATQSSGSSDFLNNLGRVYGIYTGGFVAFVILLAVLGMLVHMLLATPGAA